MNALFSDLCFPFPELQVGRVTFDGTKYFIFIFDTLCSPKSCQCFLKGYFVCILEPKPRNSTFVMKAAVFYHDNLTRFYVFKKTLTRFSTSVI